MPDRVYKDYKIYSCLALNKLVSALGIHLYQDDLEKKIDGILENDRTMVSKEDIKHEIKSNHYMTDKVLKKLEEDGFIILDRIENRYRIRITRKGVLHVRTYNTFYAEMYKREMIAHYQYRELPDWFKKLK